jgi:hypothetical protein
MPDWMMEGAFGCLGWFLIGAIILIAIACVVFGVLALGVLGEAVSKGGAVLWAFI